MGHKPVSGDRELDLAAWRAGLRDLLSEASGEAQPASVPQEAAGRREFLVFSLGDETFGVDIGSVQEILMPRPLTRLPRAPSFVLGIVSLRGAILPVADPAARLGLRSPAEGFGRIVVLRDGDEALGLAVDAVAGVVRFAPEEIRGNQYAASVDPRFLDGIGYDARGRLIALLDVERLCDFSLEGR